MWSEEDFVHKVINQTRVCVVERDKIIYFAIK